MSHYIQLTLEDRYHLSYLLKGGLSVRECANRLKRHVSTIYRELKRNSTKHGYAPTKAAKKALSRRERQSIIEKNSTLRSYVVSKLKTGWSPEQIAGRLKRKKSKYTVCHETIYRFIYKNKHKKYHQHLTYQKRLRYRKRGAKKNICRFGNKRIITNRPENVESRAYAGHWEGDSIEFSGAKKKTVTTLLERKSRFVILIKNESKKSQDVMASIAEKFRSYDRIPCKTITFDQGSEFSDCCLLEKLSRCQVYYCHAHSPWEKGANENCNKRLRRFLPRKINIHQISQEQLDLIALKMNNTPRKCLDYKTPSELFYKHYKYIRRTWF